MNALGASIDAPNLEKLTQEFLQSQLDSLSDSEDSLPLPSITSRVQVFHSALAFFHAPSDPSGIQGMRREYIRATPAWRQDGPRHDCVFVMTDSSQVGIRAMHVARVLLFFSFQHNSTTYPCALVHWFPFTSELPDNDTGMWMVEPEFFRGRPSLQVIHIDTIHRLAHLLPIYGSDFVPTYLHFSDTLDVFKAYYVSKYADHNTFDIAYVSI